MAAIAIEDLSMSYGRIHALSGVSFPIAPGEVIGLLEQGGAARGWLAWIRALAREVVEIQEPIAERDDMRLELVDLGGDDVVPGDRVRLGQGTRQPRRDCNAPLAARRAQSRSSWGGDRASRGSSYATREGIARELLERIFVDDQAGHGAAFVIELPLPHAS